jgi:leucyl-tRNA synthetase
MVDFVEPFEHLTNQGQVINRGKAMSKSLGNGVDLGEELARYGPDAIRITMLFAGPPEDDIDWADLTPGAHLKWLSRVWRLANEVGESGRGSDPRVGDLEIRRPVHRLVAEATEQCEQKRFNVAIARLMALTNVLRKAIDTHGLDDETAIAAVREGVEALVRMLAIFAPFAAEEDWQQLANEPSVMFAGWPTVEPELLVEDVVTCVVQVAGKLRDKFDVPMDVSEETLREKALASDAVQRALAGKPVRTVIVRAPRLVNVVPG